MSGSVDHDVVIVGGGPTGLGLALELERCGVDSLVLERHPSPQPIPKGQNLTQRTMEHVRRWGLEDELRAARVLPIGYSNGGLTAYGTLLGDYWHPWYRRDSVSAYYHVANERLPQYRTEAVLRRAAADRTSIDLSVGMTVDRLIETVDHVEVGGVNSEGRRFTVRARYVIGCDGNRSAVRRAAGIGRDRIGLGRTMVLAVFRSAELARLLDRYPDTSFFNTLHPDLDGYWRFLGRVDAEEGWFFHAPVGDADSALEPSTALEPGTALEPDGGITVGTDPQDRAVTRSEVADMLYTTVGAEFGFHLDHAGLWDAQVAVASPYRSAGGQLGRGAGDGGGGGRVFVAGDAAHSHPPYGGFGINLGFEDARNLGWKLAAVLHSWGGDHLLDSYDVERRPVFESTARDFILRFVETDRNFVRSFDPARDKEAFEAEWERRASGGNADIRAYAPHYRGSPIVAGSEVGVDPVGTNPSPGAVGSHDFRARAGCHLPPPPDVGEAPLIDRLGSGFALLDLGGDPSTVSRLRAETVDRGIPLTVIDDLPPGTAEHYGASLVLVRPDHYTAWVDGESTVDASAVFDCVTGVGARSGP